MGISFMLFVSKLISLNHFIVFNFYTLQLSFASHFYIHLLVFSLYSLYLSPKIFRRFFSSCLMYNKSQSIMYKTAKTRFMRKPVKTPIPRSPMAIPRYIGFLLYLKNPFWCSCVGLVKGCIGVAVRLNCFFAWTAIYEPKANGIIPKRLYGKDICFGKGNSNVPAIITINSLYNTGGLIFFIILLEFFEHVEVTWYCLFYSLLYWKKLLNIHQIKLSGILQQLSDFTG